MKTLVFNGSPRKNGDTASLIRALTARLSGAVNVVDAYRADISPCIDCRRCWTQEGCAILDGMQEVYRDIETCDNILIASPVYFSELTGPLLSVASRLQTYFCARMFRNAPTNLQPKRGAVVLVGGGDGRIDRAEATARTLLHQMNCQDIHPLVSSHSTNVRPAIEDPDCLAGLDSIARFFEP